MPNLKKIDDRNYLDLSYVTFLSIQQDKYFDEETSKTVTRFLIVGVTNAGFQIPTPLYSASTEEECHNWIDVNFQTPNMEYQ